jgi:D-alanyl-D-alanine carboxypeptidase
MLNTFTGIDGIKTGYTRASGFNLVTSLHRGERHLVGVVFGGKTAAKRNAEMRVLLTRMLSRASRNKTRKPLMLAKLRSEPKVAQRREKSRSASVVAEVRRPEPARAATPEPADDEEVADGPATDEPSETPVHIFKVRAVPIGTSARRPAPSADDTTDTEDSNRAPDRTVSPVRESFPGAVRVGAATEPGRAQPAQIRQFAPANLAESRSSMTTASNPDVRRVSTYEPPRPVQAQRPQWQRQNVADAAADTDRGDTHAPPVIRGMPPSTLGAQARALSPSSGERFQPRRELASMASGGRYAVQIGAYGSIDDAQRALSTVQDRAGRLLSGVSSVTNPTTKNGHQLFRARFTGFDANRAATTCNALRRQSVDCFVMAGE